MRLIYRFEFCVVSIARLVNTIGFGERTVYVKQVGLTHYLEQSSRSAPVCVLLPVSVAIALIALGT